MDEHRRRGAVQLERAQLSQCVSVSSEPIQADVPVVSHSPSLSSLPKALAQVVHLSKLTFSHCPKLSATSLPDLYPLPLLRDVKMNNLPLLTSLPSHISAWGTGDLSLTRKPRANDADSDSDQPGESSTVRRGEGLEVLDLGNCSLPYGAIEGVFLKPKSAKWAHLRSLTLHSNPLGTTHPNYSELLQASALLPNLQIVDAKRVVERKRKGEVSESKKERMARERRENKMKPSGANVGGTGAMRKWGGEADEREEVVEPVPAEEKKVKKRKAEDGEKIKVKKARVDGEPRKLKSDKTGKADDHKAKPAPAAPPAAEAALDPSLSVAPAKKPTKPAAKEPVFEVIDVAKAAKAAKGEKVGRLERRLKERKDKKQGIEPVKDVAPVDLKSLFGAGAKTDDNEDSGLGVGGW